MKCPRPTDPWVGLKTTLFVIIALSSLSGVQLEIRKESEVRLHHRRPCSQNPDSVPMWLGNPSRNFTALDRGPSEPLEVVWEFETGFTTGRLHKDPWGGSSWPGQPSVDENHVYFGSADGNLYCLDKRDGSLVWSFKTDDSSKPHPRSPAID